eukprot:Trichotokara_eunicae@DN5065_c0_g1_i4.p1
MWDHVKLTSSDGHCFHVDLEVARECDIIRSMADEGAKEIPFPTITGRVLEVFIDYLFYRYRYKDSRQTLPDFTIAEDIVLDLLLVANYFGE